MDLVQIHKDVWTVYAFAKGESCPVIDFLDDESTYKDEKVKILALLKLVATMGPKQRNDFSRRLTGSDHIWEFKRGRKRGPEIRVFYFYDKNKVIICTHAFIKREKTPKEYIRKTEKIRTQYFQDKKQRKIRIV